MSQPRDLYLGIGSNINAEQNIVAGIAQLRELFGGLQCSPIYRSEAVGFDGDPFLNLVAHTSTELTISQLSKALRDIEIDFGRTPNSPKYSSRHLDIDILILGDLCGEPEGLQLPREEILTNAFVLKPLADIAPTLQHPVEHKSMAQLWRVFAQQHSPLEQYGQAIWQVELTL